MNCKKVNSICHCIQFNSNSNSCVLRACSIQFNPIHHVSKIWINSNLIQFVNWICPALTRMHMGVMLNMPIISIMVNWDWEYWIGHYVCICIYLLFSWAAKNMLGHLSVLCKLWAKCPCLHFAKFHYLYVPVGET